MVKLVEINLACDDKQRSKQKQISYLLLSTAKKHLGLSNGKMSKSPSQVITIFCLWSSGSEKLIFT
jgi:hypothetical protein